MPTSIHRWIEEWFYYNFAAGSFHTKNFVADFIRLNLNFIHKNDKFAFWATLWGVRGNVRTSSIARWKVSGRFPIRYNWNIFSYHLRLRRYKQILVEVGIFRKRWVTLNANFRWKGTSPTNLFWYQKTRLIILSCGVKISPFCCFVSSQSLHVMDGQTNRWTDGETDRITIHKIVLA